MKNTELGPAGEPKGYPMTQGEETRMDKDDFAEFSRLIVTQIRENEEHPLHRFCACGYYPDFFSMFETLYKRGYLNTHKRKKAFLNRLQLRGSYDEMKFCQGVSELLFLYYAVDRHLDFSADQKLLTDSNTDVDLQIKEGDFRYNIEIKCPAFEMDHWNVLKIDPSFRALPDRESHLREMCKLESEIAQPAVEKSGGRFTHYEVKKIADEKLRDFLRSGQSKFPESDDRSINILAVSVPINNFENYWSFLFNQFSGLFVREQNGICPPAEYDKVDIVYLTSLVTGHLRPRDGYNSWDLSSCCNLLCRNPFSRKYRRQSYRGYEEATRILPNSTERFDAFYAEFKVYAEERQLPLQGLMFSAFLAEHFPHLWNQ